MKGLLGALVAVAVLVVLSACSPISSGFITGKTHTERYTYTQLMCAAYSSRGICTVWVPQTIVVPEQWRLDLKNRDETGWVYVTEETFEAVEVGDVFNGEATP